MNGPHGWCLLELIYRPFCWVLGYHNLVVISALHLFVSVSEGTVTGVSLTLLSMASQFLSRLV